MLNCEKIPIGVLLFSINKEWDYGINLYRMTLNYQAIAKNISRIISAV